VRRRTCLNGNIFVWLLAFLISLLTNLGPQATPSDDGRQCVAGSEKPAASSERFGLAEVWKVQLDLSAEEYEAMQPAVPAFGFPGVPPMAPEAKKGNDKQTSERNLFGTEFFWAQGSLTLARKI
jgi:hypothetical protein